MNDPHVVALTYVLEHDNSVSYEHAQTITIQQPEFLVTLEQGRARFELKNHYATVQEAQNVITPFIEHWQFRASVESGPRTFYLRFQSPEIIDRQPTPGIVSLSAQAITANLTMTAALTVSRQYPNPPFGESMDINHPDVRTMLDRYLGYRDGIEPLPSMAYFCAEVFTKRISADIQDAATKHKISRSLIDRVNNLASNKGGDQARHAHAIADPLTDADKQILVLGIQAMIIRAARVLADPNQSMDEIHLGNFMHTSP